MAKFDVGVTVTAGYSWVRRWHSGKCREGAATSCASWWTVDMNPEWGRGRVWQVNLSRVKSRVKQAVTCARVGVVSLEQSRCLRRRRKGDVFYNKMLAMHKSKKNKTKLGNVRQLNGGFCTTSPECQLCSLHCRQHLFVGTIHVFLV